MNNQSKKDQITNEKPVSLSPLGFKEALEALLKVKPASKEKMDKALKEHEKSKKQCGFL